MAKPVGAKAPVPARIAIPQANERSSRRRIVALLGAFELAAALLTEEDVSIVLDLAARASVFARRRGRRSFGRLNGFGRGRDRRRRTRAPELLFQVRIRLRAQ